MDKEVEFDAGKYDSLDFIAEVTGLHKISVRRKAKQFNGGGKRRIRRYFEGKLHFHEDFMVWLEEGGGLPYPNALRVSELPRGFISAKSLLESSPHTYKRTTIYELIRLWVEEGKLPGRWYKRRLYVEERSANNLIEELKENLAPENWISIVELANLFGVAYWSFSKCFFQAYGVEVRYYRSSEGRSRRYIHRRHIEHFAEWRKAFEVTPCERSELEARLDSGLLNKSVKMRVRCVLMLSEGYSVGETTEKLNLTRSKLSAYRRMWQEGKLRGVLSYRNNTHVGLLVPNDWEQIDAVISSPTTTVAEKRDLNIVRLLDYGASVTRTADFLGVSPMTVSNVSKRYREVGLGGLVGKAKLTVKEEAPPQQQVN